MKYGFVIDHRKCIGCHACTIACKSEHQVPVGSFRTWVKYIEEGSYPDTRRHFAVLRCNHCENAPCVTICPVRALFKRDNGIVDFDGDRCIGCKACMQACPYDALYINPNTNTAEKCNYCAHRVENLIEPACVIVCPVQAIISGDLDDPSSHISRLVATESTLVRKPEARTNPKLYYIEASDTALRPAEQSHAGGYIWSEIQMDAIARDAQALAASEAKARTTYDVSHDRPWGWKVSAYLWTKSISAGAFLLAAIAILFGYVRGQNWLFNSAAPQVALVFLGLTLFLLIADLKRPERFLRILLWPQWKSWLVVGGYILLAYGAIAGGWLLLQWFTTDADLDAAVVGVGGVVAAAAAVYSAFLFRQARGRVFWHSPIVAFHLFVQALLAGAAALMVVLAVDSALEGNLLFGSSYVFLQYELAGSLVAHLILMTGEVFMPEESAERKRAARLISHGIFAWRFWLGCVVIGGLIPLAMAIRGFEQMPAVAIPACVAALAGLLLWEHIWVQAGQAVPLS